MSGKGPKCDACGHRFRVDDKYRSDNDGFTGCLPCFPISNLAADKDRTMRGPCYINKPLFRTPVADGEGR